MAKGVEIDEGDIAKCLEYVKTHSEMSVSDGCRKAEKYAREELKIDVASSTIQNWVYKYPDFWKWLQKEHGTVIKTKRKVLEYRCIDWLEENWDKLKPQDVIRLLQECGRHGEREHRMSAKDLTRREILRLIRSGDAEMREAVKAATEGLKESEFDELYGTDTR